MNPNHGMLDDIVAANNKIKKLQETIVKMAERDVEQRKTISRQKEFIDRVELNGSSVWFIEFEDLDPDTDTDGD